jgi:hypothetical protein
MMIPPPKIKPWFLIAALTALPIVAVLNALILGID